MDENSTFELKQLVYHLFLPPKLPQSAHTDEENERINARLCRLIIAATRSYRHLMSDGDAPHWVSMAKMLDDVSEMVHSLPSKADLSHKLLNMNSGDVLPLYIREQNAAVLVRMQESSMDFEVFEVQPPTADVMSNPGKLVRSYPASAVRIPNNIASAPGFTGEVSSFLTQMGVDTLDDSAASTKRAGSKVDEVRDSAHPHYITNLFVGILRGFGQSIETNRVVKRIADEVCWKSAYKPWRRSPLWLIIRVAMQTSLDPNSYKNFVVHFLCHILRCCLKIRDFSGELLYAMRVKLARRVYKIQTSIPVALTSIVENYFQVAQDILEKRWNQIQYEHAHRLDWEPELLEVERATNLSIPTLYPYLRSVFQRVSSRPKPHTPDFGVHNSLEAVSDFRQFENDALSKAVASHKFTALYDFEHSVRKHLSNWTAQNLNNELAASTIRSCIVQYFCAAKELYVYDKVDQSRMGLTIVELWMALDRVVTALYPLLLDYSPEIPKGYLEPLLIASAQEIERANVLEQYLIRRHGATGVSRHPSLFSSLVSTKTFGVRYFRQSVPLQSLKQNIEQVAQGKRNQKLKEMDNLNREHNRLMELSRSSVCLQSEGKRLEKQEHRKKCQKCIHTRKANKMKIQLYEWPLPDNDLEAEMVVFELRCPKPLSLWRDITRMILHTVGETEASDPAAPLCHLDKYEGLVSWSTELKGLKPRIGLASSVKSFTQSHYLTVKIPTSEEKVCVKNSLKFRLYDSSDNRWVSSPTHSSLAKYGTCILPNNSIYAHLSFALGGTSHSSNEVITTQSQSPTELSLHEHVAFGSLRSGPHLQWLNILRNLEEGILNFGRYEVQVLITQAAWQLGPLSRDTGTREWHIELTKPMFASKLISLASGLLDRIKSNWLESTTVGTCILLVQRSLASQTNPDVIGHGIHFLIKAADVAFAWVNELREKLEIIMEDSRAQSYRQQLCEIAAICRSAYNVAEHMLPGLLQKGKCSPLIVCGIILYENWPEDLKNVPPNLQALFTHDRILSHRLAPFLVDYISVRPDFLHQSISHIWPEFSPQSGGWRRTNQHLPWLTAKSMRHGVPTQTVDFNLREGRLLIDGLPIGRIPVEYQIVEIAPSVIPGMTFTARNEIEGYQVSFALNPKTQDMVIQARAGDTVLELIPPSKLEGDFPAFFVSEFHHWLNIQEKVMEFRPLSSPWTRDNHFWQLCIQNRGRVTMTSKTTRETLLLLDIHSSTTRVISHQLSGLESYQYMHITYSSQAQTRIELPRFHLSFFFNSNQQLESSNFPEHIIDREQSSGAMIGLSSQLILCHRDSLRLKRTPRMVIIPEGKVVFSTLGHHVKVIIDPGTGRHLGYHLYSVDTLLGCLSNNSGLTSRLLWIFLHAITSHYLPDPLTQRTGTEEALHLLSEPATCSFDQLDEPQAKLLCLISELTPRRVYYPAHLRCMQSTIWMDLPTLSQHDAFNGHVESILRHAERLQVFYPDLECDIDQYLGKSRDGPLLHRAMIRNIYFYPSNIRGAPLGSSDQHYLGRDNYAASSRSRKEDIACWVADRVRSHWGNPTYTSYNLAAILNSGTTFDGVKYGVRLAYSSYWLSLNMGESWLSAYDTCRRASTLNGPFALAFCLSAVAYTEGLPLELVPVLISVTTNPRLRTLQPPKHSHYNLHDGYEPTHARVKELVLESMRPQTNASVSKSRKGKAKQSKNGGPQKGHVDSAILALVNQIVDLALKQWPNCHLETRAPFSEYIDMGKCNTTIQAYFDSCSSNRDLRYHIDQVRTYLPDPLGVSNLGLPNPIGKDSTQFTRSSNPRPHCYHPSLMTLIGARDPPLGNGESHPRRRPVPAFNRDNQSNSIANTDPLQKLLSEFTGNDATSLYRRYGTDLEFSRQSFSASRAPPTSTHPGLPLLSNYCSALDQCARELNTKYTAIVSSLAATNVGERLLVASGIWPRVSPRDILKRISLHSRLSVPQSWIKVIGDYALKLIALQRAIRIVNLCIENKHEDIRQELNSETTSHEDLDWILVQVSKSMPRKFVAYGYKIEGNFAIRTLQGQIAREMISPSSGGNSVMQLNMGEGKSSVIIPIVAAVLAKGDSLVRVVVIKPLWRTMFQILVTRLGGLAHRKVYYLPFGRHIKPSMENTKIIQAIYTECMREGGIVLAQPEHILSFKLMSVNQRMGVKYDPATNHMHPIQTWLDSHSRDVLDESDEILNVKYQLVYTVGIQEPIEDHPRRWILVQELLHITAQCLRGLKSQFSSVLICDDRPGGQFPVLKIGPDSDFALDLMKTVLVDEILDGRLASLNLLHLGHDARKDTILFLTKKKLTNEAQEFLKDICDPTTWTGLLLLRGLLACGILGFALRDKYYRVNYGLDLKRTLLAVPYIAKDVPSLRAEFGHPDVTILLTCLSYYYEGLSEAQLSSCFEMLYKLDNPAHEYDHWVLNRGGVPPEFSSLKGINIKDIKQFQNDIVPLFSHNSAVINFYLSTFVFPRSMKDFPHKLVSSAWDLAATKEHPTTGFSGTNDNRYLLPTSISQVDPLNQKGTNALILNLLLQPENNYYLCIQSSSEIPSAKDFIHSLVIQRPTIDVLLDAGAQMLDMTNEELARYWLSLRPDASAAVYFDESDELLVLPRDEAPSRLITSPFAQRLDRCIVYLDDSHTRGTDLKLPQDARGAVTLGPKVTKDRLAQSCMRMRRLGRGQSVMFFASFDIDNQIRQAAGAHQFKTIQTYDVLRWAMMATCSDIKHHAGHWVQQGQDYNHRLKHEQQHNITKDPNILRRGWLQEESRSVEKLYGAACSSAGDLGTLALENPELSERLDYLGVTTIEESRWDEQQEREVSHEIELERQVERPTPAKALGHTLHKDLLKMVQTGHFPRNSQALCSFFTLNDSGSQEPDSHLFATVDFVKTVVGSHPSAAAVSYMRPVNWVLSGDSNDLIILSPYEANALLPQIRSHSAVTLHVYAPRTTSDMGTFSDLNFYRLASPSIASNYRPAILPSILVRVQLILWSGQLYLDDYSQYLAVCAFLGLYVPRPGDHHTNNIGISTDGFIKPAIRGGLVKRRPEYAMCRYETSPLPKLRDLFARRRMGMDYARTHLGKILHGRLLMAEDFK